MKKEVIRIGDKVKIVNAEKFVRCGYPRFCGKERKIYTVQIGRSVDLNCIVIGKKTVITGTRMRKYDSDGDIPYLENRKSHIILKVMPEKYGKSFWIEAKNVKKVLK